MPNCECDGVEVSNFPLVPRMAWNRAKASTSCRLADWTLLLQRKEIEEPEESLMIWTTPILEEICVGLEINGYLPAEF